ncbi:MAG: PAS domain-containing protein [Desulfotalea sp.]
MEQLLDISTTYISSMEQQIIANLRLAREGAVKHPLVNTIINFSELNVYGMPDTPSAKFPLNGNLVGKGSIEAVQESVLQEISASLFVDMQAPISGKYHYYVWVHYTSKNNFSVFAPWSSTESNYLTDPLNKHNQSFWADIIPKNNPSRQTIITNLRENSHEQGLVFTIAKPVYLDDVFLGAISLDIDTLYLQNLIYFNKYLGDNLFLITDKGVIAASTKWQALGTTPKEFIGAKFKLHEITKIGNHYYFSSSLIKDKFRVIVQYSNAEFISMLLKKTILPALFFLFFLVILLVLRKIFDHKKELEIKVFNRTRKLSRAIDSINYAQEISNLGNFTIYLNTGEIEASKMYHNILGIKDSKHNINKFYELIHQDSVDDFQAQTKRCIKNKELLNMEIKLTLLDCAKDIWIQGEYLFNEENEAIKLVGMLQDITERKKEEQQILETTTLANLALRMAKAGSWVMDYKNTPDTLNLTKNMQVIIGLDLSEKQNLLSIADLISNATKANTKLAKIFLNSFYEAIQNTTIDFLDLDLQYLRHSDSVVIWLELKIQFNRDNTGQLITIFGICQDSTADKTLEQTLRKNEARLLEAQRIGRIGTWEWFIDNDVQTWSDQLFSITGIANTHNNKASTKKLLSMVHHKDLESLKTATSNAVKYEEKFEIDYRIIKLDGSIAHFHQSSEPIFNEHNQLVALHGTNQDITEQKMAQYQLEEYADSLRLNQERFDLSINSANIGVWDINISKNSYYMSNVYKSILGYNATDMLNIKSDEWAQFPHPDDVKRMSLSIKNHFKNKTPSYNLEIRHLCKSGDFKWVQVIGKVVNLTNKGKINRMVGIIIDIEEKHKLQQELIKAKEEAESAAIAKTNFLANMSHEIRTPMHAIIGLSHLTLKTELNEKQCEFINNIHTSSTSLLGIINDILDFSKIDAGMMALDSTNFNLRQEVRQVLKVFSIPIKNKGLRLLIDIPKDVPENFTGDPLRIRQILTNIIGNATKFTESGKVQLKVSQEAIDVHKSNIIFAIIDTGIGMNDEQCQEIFRPFNQANISTTRKFGGTGLGLSITKHLIDLMKGTISVTSEIGIGSTFTLILPLINSTSSTEDIEAIEAINSSKIPDLQGKTILVVEDNKINQKVAIGILEETGCHTIIAENGAESIVAIKENPEIELILMDVQMPVMDGLEATKLIREDDKYKSLPILAMTAGVLEKDQARIREAGMDGVVVKPVDIDALYRELGNRLLAA